MDRERRQRIRAVTGPDSEKLLVLLKSATEYSKEKSTQHSVRAKEYCSFFIPNIILISLNPLCFLKYELKQLFVSRE